MTRWIHLSAALVAAAFSFAAGAQVPAQPDSRGQLLYRNHCVACHTTQMHWRDKKLVTDWDSLKAQVRRWQAAAQLNWAEDDVNDVARFLNDNYYRLPGAKMVMLKSLPPR